MATSGNGARTVTKAATPPPDTTWGVLRGGSWAPTNRVELESGYRNVIDRNERDVIYGFRCVLAPQTADKIDNQ